MNSSTATDSRRPGRRTPPGPAPATAKSSARTVPDAPAPLRGLRISGNPTSAANACASLRAGHRGRSRGRHARRAQRLLHRRLVPAQPGRMHRSPRDRARLAHLRGGHDVGLDRGLEPVHPQLVLHPADRAGHGLHVGDRRHLLVVVQPALQLIVERCPPGYSPMPITVAPASASARANSRWFLGNQGSTKTTFMPGMVARLRRSIFLCRTGRAGASAIFPLGLRALLTQRPSGSPRKRRPRWVTWGSPPRTVSGLIRVWPIALGAVPAHRRHAVTAGLLGPHRGGPVLAGPLAGPPPRAGRPRRHCGCRA